MFFLSFFLFCSVDLSGKLPRANLLNDVYSSTGSSRMHFQARSFTFFLRYFFFPCRGVIYGMYHFFYTTWAFLNDP